MRKFNKIFVIGLSRTGTTSLSHALDDLGIPALRNIGEFHDLVNDFEKGDFSFGRIKKSKFRAYTDIPYAAYFKELDKAHENSLFIYTKRDKQKWMKSVERWFKRITPPKPISHMGKMRRKLYNSLSWDENKFSETYDRHEKEVLEYYS